MAGMEAVCAGGTVVVRGEGEEEEEELASAVE